MRAAGLVALLTIAGCAPDADRAEADAAADRGAHEQLYLPPTGSNEIFREATAAAPGHELILADLSLPAGAVGEAHHHPWEEYLYVLAGSALVDIEGEDERILHPGERFVIARGKVHTPRAGPTGVRAIVVRVHDEDDPVSLPAPR